MLSETIKAHSTVCAGLDRMLDADVGPDERLLALAALIGRAREDKHGTCLAEAQLADACMKAAALCSDGTGTPLSICRVPAPCCLHCRLPGQTQAVLYMGGVCMQALLDKARRVLEHDVSLSKGDVALTAFAQRCHALIASKVAFQLRRF